MKYFALYFVLVVLLSPYSVEAAKHRITRKKNLTSNVLRVLHTEKLGYYGRLALLKKIGRKVLPALYEIVVDEKIHHEKRWIALMYYARIGGKKYSLKGLKRALNNRQWFIRSAAAQALGYLRAKQEINLLHNVLKDRSLVVRTSAVRALGQIASKKSIKYLINSLHDPNNFYNGKSLWIRKHIVDSLMKINDPVVVPTLISLLDDKDVKVVEYSLAALTKITGLKYSNTTIALSAERWKQWYKDGAKYKAGKVSVNIITR